EKLAATRDLVDDAYLSGGWTYSPDEMEHLLDDAEAIHPLSDARRWLYAGYIAQQYEEYKQALTYFDKAEALREDLPILDLARAESYVGLEEAEKAIELAQRSLDGFGPSVGAYSTLGSAYVLQDQS